MAFLPPRPAASPAAERWVCCGWGRGGGWWGLGGDGHQPGRSCGKIHLWGHSQDGAWGSGDGVWCQGRLDPHLPAPRWHLRMGLVVVSGDADNPWCGAMTGVMHYLVTTH